MARNNKNSNNNNVEPETAPEPDRWYNITLGPSFKDLHNRNPSPKFCTLRYEFKPASIDKNQPGSLHKGKNNKVRVEYRNNQYGKPNVTFDGVSENYKENDAVLFFDGETFRLERLHCAVKRLRHVRSLDESAAPALAGPATSVAPPVEVYSSPITNVTNQQSFNRGVDHHMQGQVEQGEIGDSESSGAERKEEKTLEHPANPPNPSAMAHPSSPPKSSAMAHSSSPPNPSTMSPDANNSELEGQIDIVNDYNVDLANTENVSAKGSRTGLNIDINLPHQAESDDEIADVDLSVDETEGFSAAEALRAQVNAEARKEHASSSSTSTDSNSSSSSSGSGSGSGSSSSSDGESSDSEAISV